MDAQAVSAALTPAALAPAIAKSLGLVVAEVETALSLLARGAQPAFIARYRADRTGELRIDDLERVQSAAARAVAFELRRQQLGAELAQRNLDAAFVMTGLTRAQQPQELEDLRTLGRRKKRGPSVKARIAGLTPLSLALWQHGSAGAYANAEQIPAPLLEVPSVAEAGKKRKRRRKRKEADPQGSDGGAEGAPEANSASRSGASPQANPEASPEASVEASPEASVEAGSAASVEASPEVTPEPSSAANAEGTPDAPVAMTVAPGPSPAVAVPSESHADASSGAPASASQEGAGDVAEPTPADESVAGGTPVAAAPDTRAQSALEAPDEPQEAVESPSGAVVASPPSGDTSPARPEPEPEPTFDGEALAAQVTDSAVPDDGAAMAGARSICAALISEHPGLRQRLRKLALHQGKLRTAVVESKKDKAGRYTKFFDRSEACSSLAPTTVLAIHRGERDGVLHVYLDLDEDAVVDAVAHELRIAEEGPAAEALRAAAREAWQHGGLGKAVLSGARKLIKEKADRAVMADFCEALRPQLLAPAFGRRPLLAIDPGTQNGCRLIALAADGAVLAEETVFPLQPKLQLPQAKAKIVELCTAHAVELIVVVGGSAGREVERLCRATVKETEALGEIPIHTVEGDSVSTQASSKAFKSAMPKADAAHRRAVAAGRRVQDPLSALSKLDPRKLSLGQHQYEVDQELLRQALDQVVGTCIAKVSVDLNTADADTLARLPGMSQALAKAVITHRNAAETGFRSRNELLEVPGLVGKAFEQAAGFMRVFGGDQPLDATSIHPERYAQVTEMARAVGVTVGDLLGNAELVGKIDADAFLGQPGVSGEPLGPRGFSQVTSTLREPGRDPRPPFAVAAYHPDLGSFEDLKVGMDLEGIVTHVAGFGAFVDVGIAQEGLIHLSELSHEYVSGALDVVHIGQRVKGRVIEVTPDKKRFALSLKALEPRPERPPRPARDSKPRRSGGGGGGGPKGKGRGKGGPRGDRGDRGGGKGRGESKDRVLGFRLDLSELASRLADD